MTLENYNKMEEESQEYMKLSIKRFEDPNEWDKALLALEKKEIEEQ